MTRLDFAVVLMTLILKSWVEAEATFPQRMNTQKSSFWDPSDYRITGLEKYGSTDHMYSGYMPVSMNNNKRGSLFFWLNKPRNKTASEKLIIWLNGGPGCSSMLGMMMENGPFVIKDSRLYGDKSGPYFLEKNEFSWNNEASVLYLEQPIGTGFSRAAHGAKPIKVEQQVAEDMFGFLQSFLTVFPEYRSVPLFITGESYAGAYIPWMANYIVNIQTNASAASPQRMAAKGNNHFINLQGVAIGNGVIDDIIQTSSYTEYAYYHGLIPLNAKQSIDRQYARCLIAAEGGQIDAIRDMYVRQNYQKSFSSTQNHAELIANSFDSCKILAMVLEASGNPNQYNTATFKGYDNILQAGSPLQKFFADEEIQEALHVRGWNIPGVNFIPMIGNNSDTAQLVLTNPYIQQMLQDPSSVPFNLDGLTAQQLIGLQYDPSTNNAPTVPAGGKYYYSPNSWALCSDVVATSMEYDRPVTTVPALRHIMSYIRVMLYSGEFDLNCNFLGTLHTLENSMWNGRMWNTARRSLWRYEGNIQGEYYQLDNLSFLIVRNSGHLLPMDLPGPALQMIHRFINNVSFADKELLPECAYLNDANAIPASELNDDVHNDDATSESTKESASSGGSKSGQNDNTRYFEDHLSKEGGDPFAKHETYIEPQDESNIHYKDSRGMKLFVTLSIILGGLMSLVYIARRSGFDLPRNLGVTMERGALSSVVISRDYYQAVSQQDDVAHCL